MQLTGHRTQLTPHVRSTGAARHDIDARETSGDTFSSAAIGSMPHVRVPYMSMYGLRPRPRPESRDENFRFRFGALPPSPDTAHSPPLPSPIGCCSIRVENAPLASALRKEALGDGPVGEII